MSALSKNVLDKNILLQADPNAAASTKAMGQAVTDWIVAQDPTVTQVNQDLIPIYQVLHNAPAGGGILPRYGGATGFVTLQGTQAQIESEMDKWADIGAQIIRTDLPDSAQWLAKFKLLRNACASRNIKLMCSLRGTSGPYSPAQAADFAHRMAVEFGNQLSAYEYVNEPNLGGPRYAPAQYGPELAAVYNAIKSVNSNLLVASCGMGWDGAGKFSNWWPGAYNSGAKDHFDLFNCHLYNDPTASNWTELFNVYAQYGQGKPIIVTEAGAKTTAQTTVIPHALHDPRVMTVCIYNMIPEVAGYNMYGNPGYAAYKNTPKT